MKQVVATINQQEHGGSGWQGNGIGTSNASNSQNGYWMNIPHLYSAGIAIVNFHLLGLFLGFEMDVCVRVFVSVHNFGQFFLLLLAILSCGDFSKWGNFGFCGIFFLCIRIRFSHFVSMWNFFALEIYWSDDALMLNDAQIYSIHTVWYI